MCALTSSFHIVVGNKYLICIFLNKERHYLKKNKSQNNRMRSIFTTTEFKCDRLPIKTISNNEVNRSNSKQLTTEM